MSKPGPVPKPTALKQLEGNPGKRKLPEKEPSAPLLLEIPKPPSFLMPLAKKHWKQMAQELQACGLLTAIDLDTFGAYCNCWALWVEAQQNLKKYGPVQRNAAGIPVNSVFVDQSIKWLNQMLKYQKELGLTPSARTRVQVDMPEDEDEFSKFLEDTRSDG